MKPTHCLVAVMVIATPVHTQVDCADWGTFAFFKAAEVSDVTRCLQAGATPDVLHWAALGGNAEAMTVLLEAGANLEPRDESGNTPLHWAALGGNAEAVMALLGAGAHPKVRNNSDELPFDYARDNEKLQGTDAYWKLNEARFP